MDIRSNSLVAGTPSQNLPVIPAVRAKNESGISSTHPPGVEIPRSTTTSSHDYRPSKTRTIEQTEGSSLYLNQEALNNLDENQQMALAMQLSNAAASTSTPEKLVQTSTVISTPEDGACAPPHWQADPKLGKTETHTFFTPENVEQDRTQALGFIKEKNKVLHDLLDNLDKMLRETEVQFDVSQFIGLVKTIKEQYKEFLDQNPSLTKQAGISTALDNYFRAMIRHPSVRLLTEPLDHWNDIIPICLHLNQHREAALKDSTTPHDQTVPDQYLQTAIQQLESLLTDHSVPDQDLLSRLSDIRDMLKVALLGLGEQTHYLHPKHYPATFGTIAELMRIHGERIRRTELARLPVDAVAQRALDLFCVIYRQQNEGESGVYRRQSLEEALEHDVVTWSREEKRVFTQALLCDNPQEDILLNLASLLNNQIESGHQLEIKEDDRYVWKSLPSSKEHKSQSLELAKVNKNTELAVASQYRPDLSKIGFGVTREHLVVAGYQFPITQRGCDLKVKELNLPYLMKLPSVSQHSYHRQLDQHLRSLVEKSKVGDGYFKALDKEDQALLTQRSHLPAKLELPEKARASGKKLQQQALSWQVEPVVERKPGKPSKGNALSGLFHKALSWKKN